MGDGFDTFLRQRVLPMAFCAPPAFALCVSAAHRPPPCGQVHKAHATRGRGLEVMEIVSLPTPSEDWRAWGRSWAQ